MNQPTNNTVKTSISMDIIQLIDFAIAERLTRRSTSWATHYQSGDRPCNDGPCPGRIAHQIRGILTLTMFSEGYFVQQIVGYRLKSNRVAGSREVIIACYSNSDNIAEASRTDSLW